MKNFFISICLLTVSLSSIAQSNKEWHYFGNGSQVTALAETTNGLWVGTPGGLVYYDKGTGQSTVYDKTNSDLLDNHITGLAVDHSNDLWIMTTRGISHKSGSQWHSYNLDTIMHYYYGSTLMVAKNGTVWAGLGNGYLVSFTNGQANFHHLQNTWVGISSLAEDASGNIWMGLTGPQDIPAVAKFDGNSFTAYSADTLGFTYDAFFVYFYDIGIDGNGNKWIGHNNGELIRWKDTSRVKIQTNLYIQQVLFTDKNGYLWMTAPDSTVLKIKDTIVSTIRIPHHMATALSVSGNGTLWLGTQNGLYEYVSGNWVKRKLPYEDKPKGMVNNIEFSNNDKIWAENLRGTRASGAVSWEDISANIYPEVTSLLRGPGNIVWIGTSNGLYKYDGQNYTWYNSQNSGLPYDLVSCMALDTAGGLWAGTTWGGLAHFDGVNWKTYTSTTSGLPDDQVNDIAITSDNVVWVGTPAGASTFNGSNWQYQGNGDLRWVSDIDIDENDNVYIGCNLGVLTNKGGSLTGITLPGQGTVNTIALEGSDLWVGIQGYGIHHFDGSTWENFNPRNSPMPSDNTYEIEIDEQGNKWIGTDRGLIIYKKNGIAVNLDKGRQAQEVSLSLYPNPAKEFVSIELPGQSADHKISVYNITGQLVYQSAVTAKTIKLDLKVFEPGIYTVQILSDDGKLTQNRFVKI